MEQSKNDTRLSKFISLVLRHEPSAAGITLDKNGWADVEELLTGMNTRGHRISIEILERVVRENNKQRFCFNKTHTKIRANQGHSIDVDVEIELSTPPPVLYHGTAERFLDSIKNQGITKCRRRHVHLSADILTAISVGKRHGNPVVLKIDAAAMAEDGFKFWLSKNGVWLCEQAPWQYVSVLDNRQ